jgi:phospholipid/cholesterol/gamma-HCH transport system substrate-binding protein
MTATKQQKIRVGLFSIIAGGLLGVVLVVFAGLHFWKGTKTYHIVFQASVFGLESGADVYYNGVKVGTVDSVKIDRQDVRRVRVKIQVDDDTPVTTDTKAFLQIAGITGLKTLDLRSESASGKALAEDSVIPTGLSTIDKLTKQAEDMADQADLIMQHVNQISLKAERIVDSVATPLDDIMATSRTAAGNLANATAQLDATIGENRAAIKATLAQIQEAAKTTTALLNNQVAGFATGATNVVGELRDAIRVDNQQLHAAMVDIRQASRTFKELARDVRAKPSRLIFSDPAPDRKLP